jgi:hypothetical protein
MRGDWTWNNFKAVFVWAMPWLVIALGIVVALVCVVVCVSTRV